MQIINFRDWAKFSLFVFTSVLTACSNKPTFTDNPTLIGNPNPRVPQAAIVTFNASEAVTTFIDVSDGTNDWRLIYDDSYDSSLGLGVVGMRPGKEHSIRVTIRNTNGAETTANEIFSFTTSTLPDTGVEFPPIDVRESKPEAMEPGVTLFNPRRPGDC